MVYTSDGLDSVPKRGQLSAKYRDTFAYPTIKERVPVILCKIIDHLYRTRNDIGKEYGSDTQEGLKKIIDGLSRLRYEMQTNKPLAPIKDEALDNNAKVWNTYLDRHTTEEGSLPKWYETGWLYAECYMYRRVVEAFNMIPELKDFDFFLNQKKDGFFGSVEAMKVLGASLEKILDKTSAPLKRENIDDFKENFIVLLEVALWGNKCDLSISAGSPQQISGDPSESIRTLREFLLVDDSDLVWNKLKNACLEKLEVDDSPVIDIVMDNAGFELFTDLCLSDYLIHTGLAKTVRFRVKNQPWFVSDTMVSDIDWTLEEMEQRLKHQLCEGNAKDGTNGVDVVREAGLDVLERLGKRWKRFIQDGRWTVHADPFWTYPHDYSQLKTTDPMLYKDMEQASLVIFKGDLNYRKLVGDLNWEATVSFCESLRGFHPTPVLALRTLKADVVSGLRPGQAEEIGHRDPRWMLEGNWGLIQFCTDVETL